jgi:acetyl/propionyl-CoA carboxylase alpha subunit
MPGTSRHQKIVEEAPLSASPNLRKRIIDAALPLPGKQYVNAGTVDLLRRTGDLYFLNEPDPGRTWRTE